MDLRIYPADSSLRKEALVQGVSAVRASRLSQRLRTSRQVFWLPDLSTACAFPPRFSGAVARCRFRPRTQRRDRDGSPSSLLNPEGRLDDQAYPEIGGLSTLSGFPFSVFRRGSVPLVRLETAFGFPFFIKINMILIHGHAYNPQLATRNPQLGTRN
jgi:hypothetical protein